MVRNCLAAIAFFLLVLFTQFLAGSFDVELGAYPDEPAHYVTGLMFTEYLRQGLPGSPMRFAQDFYLHYPKVAIGSWPPAFYLVQAPWALLFGSSKASLFVLLAVITSLTAFLIYRFSSKGMGWAPALLLGMAYLLLPITQYAASLIMADGILALFAFAAVIWFARYWHSGTYRDALLYSFGVCAAVLTKGTGVALTALPVLAAVATRRWKALLHPPLWLAGVIVVLLGGTWTYLTLGVVQDGWQGEQTFWAYLADGLWRTPSYYLNNLTLLPALLLAWGIYLLATKPDRSPLLLCSLLAIVALLALHILTPVGMEPRRLLLALAPSFLLVGHGLADLGRRLPVGWQTAPAVVLVVLLGVFHLPPASKAHYGFDQVADTILSTPEWNSCAVLVSSANGVDGEGMLISEVAMRQHQPARYLLRASKLLASMTWAGGNYQLVHQTPEALQQYLDSSGMRLLVHGPTPANSTPHPHAALLTTVLANRDLWREVSRFGPITAAAPLILADPYIRIYQRTGLPCPAKPNFEVNFGAKSAITLSVQP